MRTAQPVFARRQLCDAANLPASQTIAPVAGLRHPFRHFDGFPPPAALGIAPASSRVSPENPYLHGRHDFLTRGPKEKPSVRRGARSDGRRSRYKSVRTSSSRSASSLTACERERTPSLRLACST